MRRILITLSVIAVTLISFAACNYFSIKPPDPVTEFTATADILYNGQKYVCSISNTSKDTASVTVTKPQELAGFSCVWQGSGYSVEYKDLFCRSNVEYLPQNAFASALVDVLKCCENTEKLRVKQLDSEKTVYEGECKNGKFLLTCSTADGIIQIVEINNILLKVKFSNQEELLS